MRLSVYIQKTLVMATQVVRIKQVRDSRGLSVHVLIKDAGVRLYPVANEKEGNSLVESVVATVNDIVGATKGKRKTLKPSPTGYGYAVEGHA